MMSERRSIPSQPAVQSSALSPQSLRFPALEVLLFLTMVNFALQPLTEPDFGWHLRTGLDLLKQGWKLPTLDPYSHTMPDWPWVEHAWLTDLVIGWVDTLFGEFGVILFFGAVTMGAWIAASSYGRCPWVFRLLACVLSLWVALPFLGARTQIVTLLGLGLLMMVLDKWQRGSSVVLWFLPPMFLVWSNLHGGFSAGLFWGGLVVSSSALVRFIHRRWPMVVDRWDEPMRSWPALSRLAMFLGVAAMLTVVNPYGWRLYGEIIDSLSDRFMLDTLQEWQAPSLTTLAGRSYAIYLAGLGIIVAIWYRRIEPVRWLVLFAFLVLSLLHLRNIPFFLIMSLPLFAEILHAGFGRIMGLLKLGPTAVRGWLLVTALAMGLFLLWLGPNHLQHVALSGLRPAEYFKSTSYPIEAVLWMRDHRDRLGHRLYNDYGYGGFLLWWLPEEKIFIDGRMPTWRKGDRRIFQDYVDLNQQNPPGLSLLEKYSVDWAVVREQGPLDQTLKQAPTWRNVYTDRKVSIYVREERG
jgi:hypothetical protein